MVSHQKVIVVDVKVIKEMFEASLMVKHMIKTNLVNIRDPAGVSARTGDPN